MKNLLILTLVYCSFSVSGQTTSNCDAILQHGLRNVSVSMNSEASVARKYDNHCNKDYSLQTDEQIASIEVEVFGYGGGSGSYTRDQREERLKEWCKSSEEEALSNSQSLSESSIIYGRAYDAYEKCLELQADKIQFDYQPSPDYKTININMQYMDNTNSQGIYLTGVVGDGFTYEIKYVDTEGNKVENYNELPKTPLFINNLATNILFKRNNPEIVIEGNQSYSKVQRGSITIQTSGKSLNLFYPPEYMPTIPEAKAIELQNEIDNLNQRVRKIGLDGVGSIVASMLPEAKFKELYNTNGQEWLLAFGQLVPSESKYNEYTGSNRLPDLRGRFLRGKNYTRANSSGNEQGDLELGTAQDDSFQGHKHKSTANLLRPSPNNGMTTTNVNGADNDKFSELSTITDGYASDGNGTPRPSNETRPRNITVNYFIRIN